MNVTLRIKPGLLSRLRETRAIKSEEHQAAMIGVGRSTLRRIDGGTAPSAEFIAMFCEAFDLGLGEAFDIVPRGAGLTEKKSPVLEHRA